MFAGQLVGTGVGQQYVFGGLHHEAGGADGVLHGPHPRPGPGPTAVAVHQGGVHFVVALVGEHGPPPGVEQRTIFEAAHGRLHGIEGGPAASQHGRARLQGGL